MALSIKRTVPSSLPVVNRPGFKNAVLPVRQEGDGDVINLDGFRIEPDPDPVFTMRDVSGMDARISYAGFSSIRDAYIDKYKQIQRNSSCLNNDHGFEIVF